MGQYYKTKEFEINNKILDYFYLDNLNNYDEIVIIKDKDFKNVFKDNDITIFGNDITDEKEIYLNLKILNNANKIYLKEKLKILDNDIIKSFIEGFRGIIICNENLTYYLKNIGLIKEEHILNENTYLKIDKYGKELEICIK